MSREARAGSIPAPATKNNNKMDIQEVKQAIEKIEARIEFLKTDKTVWTSAWAGPKGYTPYNHGPYLRKLETKRLKAKLKRLKKKI